MTAIRGRVALAIAALAVLAGCGDSDGNGARPTPSATATAVPTATATSAPSATATLPPTATATAPPTATATPADTATATPTGTPSLVEELEAAGLGRYLGQITPTSEQPNGVWQSYRFDPAAATAICLRGGAYRVEVRTGSVDRVLLYLEGGGACWNDATCWTAPTAKLTADPFFGDGILNFTNPDNPFRDWHVVYAPYCDGSVFGGDNTVDYPGGRTYHHGLQNLSAAVTLMRALFPDPAQIVVSGSSAGGYGTFSGYGVTRVAYPDAPILVLNDSGPGLQNLADQTGVAERQAHWRWTESVPASCGDCTDQVTYLSEWAIARDPTLRIGYFSTLRDAVIRSFLQLAPPDYEALLLAITGAVHARQPERFKRYYVQGEWHTVLELPQFYTTSVDGLTVRDWTADLLVDGPRWQDVIEPLPAD